MSSSQMVSCFPPFIIKHCKLCVIAGYRWFFICLQAYLSERLKIFPFLLIEYSRDVVNGPWWGHKSALKAGSNLLRLIQRKRRSSSCLTGPQQRDSNKQRQRFENEGRAHVANRHLKRHNLSVRKRPDFVMFHYFCGFAY